MKQRIVVLGVVLVCMGPVSLAQPDDVDGEPGSSVRPYFNPLSSQLFGAVGEHLGWWNGKGNRAVDVGMGLWVEPSLEPSEELLQLETTRWEKAAPAPTGRFSLDWEKKTVAFIGTRTPRILTFEQARRGTFYVEGHEYVASWSASYEKPFPADVLYVLVELKGKARLWTFIVPRDNPDLWRISWASVPYYAIDQERLHQAGFGYFEEGDRRALFLPRVEGGDQAWELFMPEASDGRKLEIHVFPLPLPRPEPSENE